MKMKTLRFFEFVAEMLYVHGCDRDIDPEPAIEYLKTAIKEHLRHERDEPQQR